MTFGSRCFAMTYQVRDILNDFWNSDERRLQWRLAGIWSSWPKVVGTEIADMAKPLGRNKDMLLLGVEDSMVMQEVHFRTQEILRAVNAALKEKIFDKVRLDLLSGRTSLSAIPDLIRTEQQEGKKAVSRFSPKMYAASGLWLNEASHPKQVTGNPPETLTDRQPDKDRRFSTIPAFERCYQAYVRSLQQEEDHVDMLRNREADAL